MNTLSQKIKENEDITLTDLIWALAHEVASLKEDRCENSGRNWFDRFKNGIAIFEKNKTLV